jgi:hypothetical protein
MFGQPCVAAGLEELFLAREVRVRVFVQVVEQTSDHRRSEPATEGIIEVVDDVHELTVLGVDLRYTKIVLVLPGNVGCPHD